MIVPARDAARTLGRTLRCLAAQELDRSFEVIVVDAGSTDDTAAIAAAAGVSVVAGAPVGPAGARNAGVREARAPLLAFTDADCFPTPGWLDAGVAALREAALVQGSVHADPDAAAGPFDRTIWVTRPIGLFETASLFVTRAAFERAGGFEEWLRPSIGAPHMAEDLLFGWTVRRAGLPIAFCAEAIVHHAVIPRSAREFVAERRRARYFADIARRVPELRREMFFARCFLSRRTAAFDLAVLGALVSRRAPSCAVALLPYAWTLYGLARPWGRRAPVVAMANLAADVVGLYSLVLGSVRRAAPML